MLPINRSQQVVTGGLNPRAVYSRVISCGTFLTAAAAYNFGFTPPMGDNTWLFSVDVWIGLRNQSLYEDTIFDVTVGEKLLPIDTRAGFTFWNTYNSRAHYHWEMRRLFKGKSRRFGIWGMTSARDGGIIEASFQISEG